MSADLEQKHVLRTAKGNNTEKTRLNPGLLPHCSFQPLLHKRKPKENIISGIHTITPIISKKSEKQSYMMSNMQHGV